MMFIYVALIAAVGVLYMRLPTSFLPNEDQGNLLVNIQLPPGATLEPVSYTHLTLPTSDLE